MKKLISIFLAFIMFISSMGLNLNMMEVFASSDISAVTDGGGVTTSGAAIIPNTINIAPRATGSSQFTFSRGGTKTNPTVEISIDTQGKDLVGITYERGFGKTASNTSQRVYTYDFDEATGIVTLSFDNITRYISVMAVLYDPATGTYSNIVGGYELSGTRVFNGGSASFSNYPTVPLTDSPTTPLMGQMVSDSTQGGDNGPLIVAEDEVWIGGVNGLFDVYSRANLDAGFGKNKLTEFPKKATVTLTGANFTDVSSSAIYDGKYIMAKTAAFNIGIIEAESKTVINNGTTVATISTIIQNYSTVQGKVAALTYDNENLYILTGGVNPPKIYVAPRQSDGTYILNTTPLYTLATGEYYNDGRTYHGDITFDGENLWVVTNTNKVVKYNIASTVSTVIPTDGQVGRIIYDGSQYIYAMGLNNYVGSKGLNKIDASTGTNATLVYKDTTAGSGVFEDMFFDGRNVWITTYGIGGADYERYDTQTGGKVTLAKADYDNNVYIHSGRNFGNAAGVYDGKYAIFYNYNHGDINMIGRVSDTKPYLKYGNATGTSNANLAKHFAGNPLLEADTIVYVDDLETTSPNYVDIKTVGAESSSDIVFAAWSFGETAKTESFFKDMNNYANDDNYADWTPYLANTNKYYQLSNDELPKVDASGKFNFSMKALPKLNGVYTLYMINADGSVVVESITINNYKEMGRINIYAVEVDSKGKEIVPRNYVVKDINMEYAVGSSGMISIKDHLAFIEEAGYIVYGASSRLVNPIPQEGVETFYVEKNKSKWTEIIKKPYYLDEGGNKVYIGTEIATGQYYLVSPEGTDIFSQNRVIVEAAHLDGYSILNDNEATKTVYLPFENGGNATSFGRTVVEYEYTRNDASALVIGIEVDKDNVPTGNLVYTKQVSGSENEVKSVKADTAFDNWNFVGLVNYNTDGDFSSVSSGISSKDVTFGTDSKVTFAYTRKQQAVKVIYVDETGNEIKVDDGSGNKVSIIDFYNLPLNSNFTFVAKAIDGYKLVDPKTYTSGNVKITDTTTEIYFEYTPLIETIKLEAVLADGTVIARDSVDASLGSTVSVSATELARMLAPRYTLVSDVTKPGVNVTEDTVVKFEFKPQTTLVTVKYVDASGKEISTAKSYTVFYGENITEDARSIENYYYDTTTGLGVSRTIAADKSAEDITFKYIASDGAISVLAKDSITGQILSYSVENGTPGTILTVNPSTYFNGKEFLGYYELDAANSPASPYEIAYTNKHQEYVFLFTPVTYDVTIKAEDTEGNPIKFFDGTQSKTFTYNKGKFYSIYAPPVTGYKVDNIKIITNSSDIDGVAADENGIVADRTFTFVYEPIDTKVNLVVKAIDTDGNLIKSVVVTGDRNDETSIDIFERNADGTDGKFMTDEDLEKWEILATEDTEKTATFGVDKEVLFTFVRKTVTVTVQFLEEGTDTEIASEVTYTVPTMSDYNVFARHIDGYELVDTIEQIQTVTVGTVNVNIPFYYTANTGNVLVLAAYKDENDETVLLEGRYYNGGATGSSYTFTDFADFKTYNSKAFEYDETSNTTLTVSGTDADNILVLYFTKKMYTVTVQYLDEDGNTIYDEDGNAIDDVVYKAQNTTTVYEYATNIDFYNLISNNTVTHEIDDEDVTIKFFYKKVDYSIVTDGVINVIAKDSTNGNIIDIKSFQGTIDEEEFVDATAIFDKTQNSRFIGYELDDEEVKSAVYKNGFINIEFAYKPIMIDVTIAVTDTAGNNLLDSNNVSIPKTYKVMTVRKGGEITVYAPHIDNHIIVGKTSETFKDVSAVKTATFTYEPIGQLIIGKGIEVDENGAPTGNTVYVKSYNGNKAVGYTVNAEVLSNWTLEGLYENGAISTGVSSKNVIYGTDDEVVFAYSRKMVEVTVSYVEDVTGEILGVDKFTVPLNDEFIVTAKAVDGYRLKDPATYQKTIAKVTESNKNQSFTYVKLTEGVVIEAVLADGTVLARDSIDYPLGAKNVNVSSATLGAMVNPRYILVDITKPTQSLSEVKKDSVVTFVYKEQLSKVTINYVDDKGAVIAPAKTYEVPYGTAIRESAKSIADYYVDTTASNANYNVASASLANYSYNFVYKKANGVISVIAKDAYSKEILYYKTYQGTQGANLIINSNNEFSKESFINYYTLVGDVSQTLPFTNGITEMIFYYSKDTYTVTISAGTEDGKPLNFFDGTSSKEYTYNKGDKYEIYAPPVKGYKVVEPLVVTNTQGITANKTFKFTYELIDVDENLAVKAISSDGKYIIGSKIISGERNATDTIDVLNYVNDLYNPKDWTLSGEQTYDITYGIDNEVIFTFTRNKVDLTINHIIETTNGDVISSTQTVKVDTNSNYTSNSILITDYQLKDTENHTKVTAVGNSNAVVEYRYEPISGNVIVYAVDSTTGDTLAVKGFEGITNAPYELTQADIDKISSLLSPAYKFNTSSVTSLDNVNSSISLNNITLKYDRVLSNITVKYVDQFGVEVFPTSTYAAQYGTSINEYAVNVDFYNLTSAESFVKIAEVSKASYDITFEYRKVDYTIVTDGVINVIAKISDGNGGYKVLDFKSFNGTIGNIRQFDANDVFGNIVGYTLVSDPIKSATYVSGFVEVEYIYEQSDLAITIVAIDKKTGSTLTFSEPATVSVIEGGTVTVHAPHITAYEVSGPSYQVFENVTSAKTATFEYIKIAVPNSITIKHISYVNGYQVAIKTVVDNGNIGDIIQVNPMPANEALALGYVINNNYNYTKTLTHGVDREFVYLYDRIMSDLMVNHHVEIYETDNTTLINKLTNEEKLASVPLLADTTSKVESNTYRTVIAPFDSRYVINPAKNTEKLRQTVYMDSSVKVIDYYYRNITGNVLIRAVVEDEKGTLVIDGKNYKILGQVDDNVAVGDSYSTAKANAGRAYLDNILLEAYALAGIIEGDENFVMTNGDTYQNHVLTYEYTADHKEVSVYYYDEDGTTLLDPAILGIDSNPQIVKVIKGEYISQYAINVQNYNFEKSSINVVATRTARAVDGVHSNTIFYNEQVNNDLAINFVYKKINLLNDTKIYTTIDGVKTVHANIKVVAGQTIYAPYKAGYEPIVSEYTINDTINPSYEFIYKKIKPTIVYETETNTVYVDRPVNVEVPVEVIVEVPVYDNTPYPIESGKLYVGTSIPYVSGYTDGTFRPEGQVTRAEVAVMFYNLTTDVNKGNYVENKFWDIEGTEWYSHQINYLASQGILSGYTDGSFKPQATITRAEFAAIASRFDYLKTSENITSAFNDVNANHWAIKYIDNAYTRNWMRGYPTGEFKPDGKLTRAETVRIINCMTGRANKNIYTQANNKYTDVTTSHWAFQEIIEATIRSKIQ